MNIQFNSTKYTGFHNNNRIEISKIIKHKSTEEYWVVTVNIHSGFGFYITNEAKYLFKLKVRFDQDNNQVKFKSFDDAIASVNLFFEQNSVLDGKYVQ